MFHKDIIKLWVYLFCEIYFVFELLSYLHVYLIQIHALFILFI